MRVSSSWLVDADGVRPLPMGRKANCASFRPRDPRRTGKGPTSGSFQPGMNVFVWKALHAARESLRLIERQAARAGANSDAGFRTLADNESATTTQQRAA